MGRDAVSGSDELQQAVAWVLAQPAISLETIERASQRFELSPLEAAVLFRYFSPSVSINTH